MKHPLCLANSIAAVPLACIAINSAAESVQVALSGIPESTQVTPISRGDAAKINRPGTATTLTLQPFAAVVLRITAA